MNKPFENKKLLILGATPNEIPVVKRAQELGAYVITTDYNKDYKLSPAKYYSDECWDISWSDIEELKKRCVESGVTGVIAGFSEIRVDNQIRLCKELGLPCYVNEEQLAITRDKILFKEKCRQYDVPVIKEYSSMDDVTEYPVIVKPTDRAGSIGVGIAYNRAELEKAYDIAMDKSLVKRVIIEDYITDAMEMDAHYVVLDGEISLLTTDDIIAASDNVKDNKVVQSVWMYPSKYNSEFLATADQPLRDLIKGIGVKNGTIFFSGFVNNKGQFSFFECGFRLWGEQEFNYDYKKVGINYLDAYLYHVFNGNSNGILFNPNPTPTLKGVSLNLYVTGGTIAKLQGVKELDDNKDCFLCLVDSYVGQKCTFDNAILTKAGLVGFANEDPREQKKDIDEAYESIVIEDENGKNMLYERLDTQRIIDWWE